MDDTISRQAAIEAVLELDAKHRVSWKDAVIDTIDALPSAQSEHKKGKWIRHGVEEGNLIAKYTCSECYFYSGTKTSNFCPDCGAEMIGEVDE